MGNLPEEVGSIYQVWVNKVEKYKKRNLLDRECIHLNEGAQGKHYRGEEYLNSLQKLRGSAAMKMARKVTPFFWSDAARIRVWLCRDCATEVGLESPLGGDISRPGPAPSA